MRVLIAEDDVTSHQILMAVLNKWGYEVVSTRNGREAWQALQDAASPRLAILDWMMPEMDGVEIIRKIRERSESKTMYIILLTAKGRKEDIVSGLETGADDYITKPFDREELHARVQVGQRVVELQCALEDRIQELQDALDQIKTLKGLIPMCASCKKIRDDEGYWQQVETYIMERSEAEFSHGLCPDCLKKHYPEYYEIKAKKELEKKP